MMERDMERDVDLYQDDLMDLIIEEEIGGDEDCKCGHVRDEHVTESRDCMIEDCACIQFEEA